MAARWRIDADARLLSWGGWLLRRGDLPRPDELKGYR
jgi:hypothetical protein